MNVLKPLIEQEYGTVKNFPLRAKGAIMRDGTTLEATGKLYPIDRCSIEWDGTYFYFRRGFFGGLLRIGAKIKLPAEELFVDETNRQIVLQADTVRLATYA